MADQQLNINIGATNRTGGVFAQLQREVKNLKTSIGGESAIGQGLAVLRGGGIAAGILGAVRVVGDLAEGFARAREEGVSMVTAISDAMKSNPLFGTFINTGAAINELITGNAAAARATLAQAAANDAKTARMAARGNTLAGALSGSIGGADAIAQLLGPLGMDERTLRARLAEAMTSIGRGPMSIPAQRSGFDQAVPGEITNQAEIDAAKAYNAELAKLTETVKEYAAIIKAIDTIRVRNDRGSALAGVFGAISGFVTPEVVKRWQDAQKPSLFGFRIPFIGSANDRARQAAGELNFPNSPFGGPGADPLTAAIEARGRAVAGARGAAGASLASALQSQLASATARRMGLASILSGGVSADTRIGMSGLQSAGAMGAFGASAEERRLERAIAELSRMTKNQTDETVSAIEDAKAELVRTLRESFPGIGNDLFDGQR